MTTTPRLPTGTVTFLFTDIEGSTALWSREPHGMSDALAAHDALFRAVVAEHDGAIFKTVGDAICAAFARAGDAIAAAIDAQRRLAAQPWPETTGALRVRMGIHTGQAIERDDDYFGPALNRVARVMGIAHGRQVLVTQATAAVLEGVLDAGIRLRELGVHYLKGLIEPEKVYQIEAPGLHADFPPLASNADHPNNLPAQISSFVGRTRELALLPELLERVRLLTIAGPGGIGKTRLALALASSQLGGYPGGAWFVELATLRDGELIVPTLARSLAVAERPDEPLEASVIRRLQQLPTLLVLDNSEHLLTDVAKLALRLLAACASLRIVTTSREPLFVTGEHVFRLTALPLAGEGRSEAVQLFLERAHRVGDAAADDASIAAIERICRRLEGIPLAIELAAARTGGLALAAIEARLTDRLSLLVSRDVTRSDRQRTLRATIDWSYRLLTPAERRCARAVSAFAGGFSIAAAAFVGALDDTVDVLESLHDKSLIAAAGDSPGRYVISDTIAEYLRATLVDEGEADAAGERHFDFFFDAVTNGVQDGAADSAAAVRTVVEEDAANVRRALHWGLAHRLHDTATLVLALARHWQKAGLLIEGERWFRRVLERPEIADALRAPLLRRASTFATMRSHHEEARRSIVASRLAYERLGDRSGIAETTYNTAVIEHRLGNAGVAEELYRAALAGFEATNHVTGATRSSMNLALLARERRDYAARRRISSGPSELRRPSPMPTSTAISRVCEPRSFATGARTPRRSRSTAAPSKASAHSATAMRSRSCCSALPRRRSPATTSTRRWTRYARSSGSKTSSALRRT
jgi:predicted ATPase/class 3 adenylate cyclase